MLSDELVEFSSTSTDNADDKVCCSEDTQANKEISRGEKLSSISYNNYASFEEEVLRLERRANLKNAKEFLLVIEEDVEHFYKNYQLIKNGVLSDKNYGHLQELKQDIELIAGIFEGLRILEQDYKIIKR